MSQPVPAQHPAVVLRSQFNQLRVLLAVMLIALLGLAVAVVVLATEETRVAEIGASTSLSTSRSDGGPEESAVAAAVASSPTAARPDESDVAAAIGYGRVSPAAVRPDESDVAAAISSNQDK